MFSVNAQDSAALQRASLFVKDDRLHPLWRVISFVIAVPIVSLLLWSIYFIAIGGLTHEPSFVSEEISGEIATAISALLVALWLRRFVDRRSIDSLGFAPRGPGLKLLLLGVAFGAGMQAVAFVVEVLTKSTSLVGFGNFSSDAKILAAAFGVFLAGALLEELSFRGYLFQNFWEAFGAVPAIVITSLLFAGIHLYNPNAQTNVVQTLLGLLLYAVWASCSLLWTRSLWLALGAHLAWNLFEGPVFGFPVSGLAMPARTILTQNVSGPAWLTGGAFGPEAGVSSLVALTLGFVVLRLLYVRGTFAKVPDPREAYAR